MKGTSSDNCTKFIATISVEINFSRKKMMIELGSRGDVGFICAPPGHGRTNVALSILQTLEWFEGQRIWVSTDARSVRVLYPDLIDFEASVIDSSTFDICDIPCGSFVVFDDMQLSKEQLTSIFVDRECVGLIISSDSSKVGLMVPHVKAKFCLFGYRELEDFFKQINSPTKAESKVMADTLLNQSQSHYNMMLLVDKLDEMLACRFKVVNVD
jgi:hypothetical protein